MRIIVTLFCLLIASDASAWRETGHFVVCEIAYRHLTPEAKAAVDQLAGPEFPRQCTWPDMVRKGPEFKHTYDWHFINLEPGKEYFDSATINTKGDVLQAILKNQTTLRSSTSSNRDKKHALRFLGHFVGDLHQPLHTGHKSDLGGNRINPLWFGAKTFNSVEILQAADCPPGTREPYTGECVIEKVTPDKKVSLHKIWDLQMLEKYMEVSLEAGSMQPVEGDSPYHHLAYSSAIDQRISARTKRIWQASAPVDWMLESLSQRDRAYKINGTKIKSGRKLGITYYRKNIGYINKRLAQAGYRLAALLNRIYAPQNDLTEEFLRLRHIETEARFARVLP